ncbi:MAG: 3'(2'),5'-bisphosphate nucleotidase CysQ [Acidimicrobiia bacterium]
MIDRSSDLRRISEALATAGQIFDRFPRGPIAANTKANSDPVTEADLAVDRVLREVLVGPGEGWFSEETVDDQHRLSQDRVWVVDPLDGTREFVAGIPEWCISVGLVEDGQAVAGGIFNPWVGFLALGANGVGCTLNGVPARPTEATVLNSVLASRTEVDRGQWSRWAGAPFRVEPMGSVAFKLARVAVGLADATWTLVPKHEWDVAGGVALLAAAGAFVITPEGSPPQFNRPNPRLSGLLASGPNLESELRAHVLEPAA